MILAVVAISVVAVGLAGIVIWQQLFFFKQTQLLVNKIMSGDYHAYVRSDKPAVTNQRVPVPQDPPEDLRILQGFQL